MFVISTKKGKLKCTLVQALRLCTGLTARRGSRGIALPFHDHDTRRRWGVSVTLRPLFTPGTHCTGGCVGLRADADRCGKSRPHRDSIPGPSSPKPVTIPTELPGPLLFPQHSYHLAPKGMTRNRRLDLDLSRCQVLRNISSLNNSWSDYHVVRCASLVVTRL